MVIKQSIQPRTAQNPNSASSYLGMLGGGQLGRMFVHAAQAMGFKVLVLEPEVDCPAGQAADQCLRAAYDDASALAGDGQLVRIDHHRI